MGRIIRRALMSDKEAVEAVFSAARKIMVSSGNLHQWSAGYPSVENLRADIERDGAFVVEDAGCVVGYFAFLPSPEPTYATIYKGRWKDDQRPYHVIHRISSLPDAHGIFKSIIDYCHSVDGNLRIDTHRDNHIMRHNILKHGFTYCGIIHLASGDERLAYQRVIPIR